MDTGFHKQIFTTLKTPPYTTLIILPEMSVAGTEAFDFAPSSPAAFSQPLGNPILNWHYKTARNVPPVTDTGSDSLDLSPPGSPLWFTLSDIPSRPGSPVLSVVDDNLTPARDPFPHTALAFQKLSITSREPQHHEPIHNYLGISITDTVPIPDETTASPALLDFTIHQLGSMSPEDLERRESTIFSLKDPEIKEEPQKLAKAVLRFLLKDVTYTGPFYLLSANNALYVLMTIYPPTEYAEVRANILYNIGCAGMHYLSGSLKYDVLNNKDFRKFRPITYAMLGMILGHLARAFHQCTILSEADRQEPWPTDHSLFNEANQIRFAMAGWTFIEIVILEFWYSSAPLIR
ncbi:hypothetical protein D9619_001114 [Psilocybe cf. subviscida]|uniref:Uncharacterized protein n=1 Tax=Psilocybe cf. subviscida TaxID=2480587 RepID=A0A8H5BFZ7_9AGAR|nr:hypothetical protein D9619_001114 [Psilocybe cf. subviscida]